MFGFLNVYKPKGKTSHDVVAILRRVTKVKQIGHTGTLDPFAEGVLPICIGKATRLIEYLKDDKAYIATVQLGNSTTTYDIEGEVVKSSSKDVSVDEIKDVLKNFEGEIEQYPPIYSAIKVNGKKLYEYARKGEEVEIKPRKVNITKIEVLNYDKEQRTVEILVECSKGTYIRSIANDLGEILGTFGYLTKLIRVKAGNFILEKSVKLDDLTCVEDVNNNLINPIEMLDFPLYELNKEEVQKVSNGMGFVSRQAFIEGQKVILISERHLAGIAENIGRSLKCLKVFL